MANDILSSTVETIPTGLPGFYNKNIIHEFSKELTQYQDIARFRYYRATNQAIPTGTNTKIQIDTLSIDPLSAFSSSNNRMIVQIGGIYWVYGQVQFAFNANTAITLSIFKNNTSVTDHFRNSGNAANQHVSVGDLLDLNRNDYIELFINHNVGVNTNVSGGSVNTYLTAFMQSRKY